MSAGFTPGPWKLREVSDLDIAYSVETDRKPVADVYNHPDEWEANARLIAAAPELYEALQYVLRRHPYYTTQVDALNRAEDALAKARGEQVPE